MYNFILFSWNRGSSHVWWRSVPNRIPCHVQNRDVEQALGGMEEVDRQELFRRAGEQFSRNRKLTMCGSGQCLIEPRVM
ncbi:hypothetical protein CK938_18780 [Bacillus cereus]|nr:hypothetical protein CK938_18780 [Bacillus cereus]